MPARWYKSEVPTLEAATWNEIAALRENVAKQVSGRETLCAAAQEFASLVADSFSTSVLSRVFALVPYSALPVSDAKLATSFASAASASDLLTPRTPVLSLLGTRGKEASWNDRTRSASHLAIPLLSEEHVRSIPMITRLLGDLGVRLDHLVRNRSVDSRQLAGSTNQCFYIEDAATARDALGRLIIPAFEFVAKHDVKTVFGMGGCYVDGTMIVSITFAAEHASRQAIDRLPSIISDFKMATTDLVLAHKIY